MADGRHLENRKTALSW